ncbi:hypothetical protein ABZZ20_21715 [Streptomyces sp. NPDC006430]|uniref:hypothetical protein n=1 Tax=Streptomyces sp. NPDC006430 TaxID=3154299 RepID=UPI0033A6C45B
MTAWQYLAGAGLTAVLCPLHGHVAVADDGSGHGGRVDVCVPAGRPGPPAAVPSASRPSVRAVVPGAQRPTVHHPGRSPARAVADLPVPTPKARAAGPEPVAPAPGPGATSGPVAAEATAPPRAVAVAAPGTAFHVRPYHSRALERHGPGGLSTVMLMVVVTTPAVLAAAALRPRSKSCG